MHAKIRNFCGSLKSLDQVKIFDEWSGYRLLTNAKSLFESTSPSSSFVCAPVFSRNLPSLAKLFFTDIADFDLLAHAATELLWDQLTRNRFTVRKSRNLPDRNTALPVLLEDFTACKANRVTGIADFEFVPGQGILFKTSSNVSFMLKDFPGVDDDELLRICQSNGSRIQQKRRGASLRSLPSYTIMETSNG